MVMLMRLILIIFQLVIHYCRKSEQAQKINCTEEYRGSSGFIESPGYPNGYSNNLDCKWRIQSSRGRVIMITIEDFELQKKYKAKLCEDYLMIIDTVTSKFVLHKTCGELNIPNIRNSYCHDIEVIFHSDRGGNEKGFRLTWNTEKTKQNNRNCGENVTTVSGEATTKLLNKYITSSSMKFKVNTTSYAVVTSTKYGSLMVDGSALPSSSKSTEVKSSSERTFLNSETLVIYGIVVLALLVVITFATICVCLFLYHMTTISKRDRASNVEMKQLIEELKTISSGAYMQLDFTRSDQVKSTRYEYTNPKSNSVEIVYETPT